MPVFDGTAFKQNDDAPWEFSFVANVKEISPFCGVPRKREGAEGGFQRAEDPARITRLASYFSNTSNSSPTSIVLGFHPLQSTLNFVGGRDGDTIRTAQLEVQWPVDEEPIEDIIARVLEALQERIGAEDGLEGHAEEENVAEEDVAEEDVAEEDVAEEDEAEEDDGENSELDFAESVITELIELLSDDEWVADVGNHGFIRDLGKPALVIDGQHRLLGAEDVVGDIPFSFVALTDASWAEMVFQFCVINHCAVPVNPDVINTNAALSLTNQELMELGERLIVAGFQDAHLDIMNRCYLREGTPFHGRVVLSYHNQAQRAGKMGQGGITRLAKHWRNGTGNFLKAMRAKLYEGENLSNTEKTARWKTSGDWARAFNLFWEVFSEKYATYNAGGPTPRGAQGDPFWGAAGSNINKTGCLIAFQEQWFTYINGFTQTYKNDGINIFEHPNAEPGETVWDVLRDKAQKAVSKGALRNMLENRWSLVTLTHGNAKTKMKEQFGKAFRNEALNWTTKDEFQPAP